ncbi:unnamed protein product [Rotaria magnacalcarata]|uniref:Sidoreflexin n=3 Tax=Rotaria magnacalcarata TaxID=392030 RepID=A0A815X708_9BILA|nr:unnamed protein product [Rotaria magnacalcarata]CAF1566024.1 unnamed protein product [Rotaria magnacalcarata]CAF2034927.1 unnamed protein product [Rotaria magnacalcarata]CAF2092855.1 unnamed protein product [Rotaria magnacalcarata]CAF2180189.1 unnamed protein product [Rotaria magnacalcarata]
MSYPPFELGKSRYDLDTYWGRFLHFVNVIDPRTLFVSNTKLNECRQLLEQYKTKTLPSGITDKDLWEAQKTVQAILHPDTGDKIFMPLRMAGYVPFGTPIVVGLLLPDPTLKQIIFWQWLNQSHNAGVNYANRNATQHTPVSKFITGYLSAVTVSVSIAVGLTMAIRRAKSLPPTLKNIVQRFVPLPAVACASTCNVIFMRYHELNEGIEVVDEQNNPIGVSKVAAKKALTEMAMTRAFLPVPILSIPPLILLAFEKNILRRFPRLSLPLNTLACTFSFGLALPISIALFPQRSKVSINELEKEIQARTNQPYVYYNKGL